MNVMPYESWSALRRFNEDADRLFSRGARWPFDESNGPSIVTSHWIPAVDVKEEPDRFVISADVPGVTREDIGVTMENGILTIKGERKLEKDSNGYRRTERVFGSFHRRFALPNGANAAGISATCTNGVLEVVIPKADALKPRRIEVSG